MINPLLHHTMVSNNINNPTQIKDSCRSSRNCNRKLTSKPPPDRTGIKPDLQSDLKIDGANDVDEFTCGRDTKLRQDERLAND